MKKIVFTIVMCFYILSNVTAQIFDTVWASKLQTALNNNCKQFGVVGASMAVYHPEQGFWTGTYGISSKDVPITEETAFGIGSISKSYLAVVMLKLQEQKILSLDDPIDKWLPSFKNVDSTVTIRQLLSHESGIFDFANDNGQYFLDSIVLYDISRIWTPEEIIGTIGSPKFAPGHGCIYSNTNHLLAGLICEKATGKKWFQLIRELIIDPLKLEHTFIGYFEKAPVPYANEWFEGKEFTSSPIASMFTCCGAAGSIFSIPKDVIKYWKALLDGSFLSKESLEQLMHREPTGIYSMGLLETYIGGQHNLFFAGETLGYISFIIYDVQSKSFICITTNGGITESSYWNFLNSFNTYIYYNPKKLYDAGIYQINNPGLHTYGTKIAPVVKLKNFGSTEINQVKVCYQIDNGAINQFEWLGALKTGLTVNVVLPEIAVSAGYHLLSTFTTEPNVSSDDNNYNDTARKYFFVITKDEIQTGLNEGFEGDTFPPFGWMTKTFNKDHWCRTKFVSHDGKYSAAKENYYLINQGTYELETPMIDISTLSKPILSFDYAYALSLWNTGGLFKVFVSKDTAKTWEVLHSVSGNNLRTILEKKLIFYPQNNHQWKNMHLSLNSYSAEILIRFQFVDYNGSQFFIDNVKVESDTSSGISPVPIAHCLSFYPNPSKGLIHFNCSSDITISSMIYVYDYVGRLILTQTLPATQQGEEISVDLSSYANGMYLVKLNNGGKVYYGKVILKK